jgi:hypothetical protein
MTTVYRAFCAELLQAIDTLLGQGESPANPGERLILTVHLEELEDCANRLRAALAQPEPVALTRPDCFDFAMDFLGGTEEAKVRNYIERLESAARTALAQPEPEPPTDGEVTELVAWLRRFADAKKGWRRGTTAAALALKVTRAANLLEILASDNAGLAAAADSLYTDNMSLLDGHHD